MKFTKKLITLLLTGSISLVTPEITLSEDISISTEDTGENKIDTKEAQEFKYKEVNCIKALTETNIRMFPTLDSEVLNVLKENETLKSIGKYNEEWYQVEYDGKVAYVTTEFSKECTIYDIDEEVQKIGYFDEDTTIKTPSEDNKVVKKNQMVDIYRELNGFYIATIDGELTFIKKEDIKLLDGTYVVVDISDQELNLYKDNEVILTTPVITGKPSTPTNEGLFEIYDITTKRKLIPSYVFVDVMMKFDGNIGLHDAEYDTCYDKNGNLISHGWKSTSDFGGTTYLTNGSHGCVNMLNSAALEVYDNVDIGTKVLVKK